MLATINIHFKEGVLDTQGKAVKNSLKILGFKDLKQVNVGKQITLKTDASTEKEARKSIKLMCEKLLVNEVLENYEIIIHKNS